MGGQSDETQNGELNRYFVYTVVGIAVLAGLYVRLAGRGDVHLFGDEFHSVWNLNKPYGQLFRLYDTFGSGTALPVMQRASIDLFGAGLWAYRFAATIGAVGALLLMYPVARRLVGQTAAIIATLALSASSIHIFYSQFGRCHALVVFLSLLLVYALCRIINGDRPALFWHALLALSAGLLPWVHLTTAVFVAGLAVAGAIMIIVRKQSPRDLYRLFTDFAIGSGISIGLYLPAWGALKQFVGMLAGRCTFANFGVLDVVNLLAGNRPAGLIMLAGVPAAAIWMLIRYRSTAFLLVAATFAPVVGLAAVRPAGETYAYARWLLAGLPFMLMLLAWLLVQLVRRMNLPKRLTGYAEVVAGAILVGAAFLTGPMGLNHTQDGPFANTYLTMMPLPAFDVPWDRTPAFYKTLASSSKPVEIIEAPELVGNSVLLYRNYYLQHRKKVLIGLVRGFTATDVHLPAGPYVPLSDTNWDKNCSADYLILHLNALDEASRYWSFVYNQVWPTMADRAVRSLMIKQAALVTPTSLPADVAERLRAKLGRPVYEDSQIVVWNLKSPRDGYTR